MVGIIVKIWNANALEIFGNEAKGLITIKSCTEVWSKYTGNIKSNL